MDESWFFFSNYLSDNFNNSINWNRILFFWGDERCVPPTDSDSNYKLAKDNLFSKIEISRSNIYRIKGENDPIVEAKEHSKLLEDTLPIVNGYPPRLMLSTLFIIC